MRSLTSPHTKCISGPRKFRSSPKNDFCNNICQIQTRPTRSLAGTSANQIALEPSSWKGADPPLDLLRTTQGGPITQRHRLNEPALAPLVVLHIAERFALVPGDAEIELLDVLVRARAPAPRRPSRRGRFRGCSRGWHISAPCSCSARRAGTRHLSLALRSLDDLEDLFDDLRRKPHRRLVEQDHLRAATSARGRSRTSAVRRRTYSRRWSRGAPSDAGNRNRRGRGHARSRHCRPCRVKAPVSRFSSTVRCAKQWRPSIT